jgi:signal transduction histidine kinase
MSRRNGSLATRALVVTGAGVAVVSAVVVAGAWILADRVASDAAAFVAEGIEGSARESIVMLRWALVGGAVLVTGAAAAVAAVVVRREVLAPLRQLRETADRVGRGEMAVRAPDAMPDELGAFSASFNAMLDSAERAQRQLATVNEALDLKVGELSEANVGLGESNRLKSEFLANVSHELRTPLNSIIGFADLLEEIARSEQDPDPKRLRYIGNIQRSGRSLLDMINELLDMAKIEAGRMEVTMAPTSVGDVAEGLQTIMRPLAMQKRVDLQLRAPGDVGPVETDAGKLQQILYNFMSNAVKFSPEDGVVILGIEEVTRDGSPAVRISVTDHGPGIPEDMQDTIFEKFRQVDASHTRRAGGTGLGLAICRELADLLGCTVGLVSAPGRGSTFWVEVPRVHRPRALKPLMG